jgi:cobalt-zinc-cadmium resistance protein CzcA
MITGVRSDLAIKIFGDEIDVLKNLADRIVEVVNSVQGASDIRVERLSGQRYLTIEPDRHDLARHGINIADINDILEIALAGKTATTVYEGEKRFSASVRYDEAFRASADAIGHTMLKSQGGAMLHLEDVATIREAEGPAQISREMARRRLVIGVNVQGRDLGGFVSEMQQKIGQQVSLPPGYYLSWGGQFENLERAMHHLQIIIPVTLAAIFFMLFLLFSSLRFASMILLILPFASMGGIYSLFISGEYLSVPASVGFITLWGIAVLNGVVLVTCIRSLHREHHSLANAIRQGCQQRFRPVMMTATVAMLGLIPFLFATGPGSEVQRPLAVVVIGGLVTSTLMTLLVLPCIYQWWFSRYDDEEA